MKITFYILLLHLLSCQNTTQRHTDNIEPQPTGSKELYNFNLPSKTFVLGSELSEASGLSYDSRNNRFITNEDETGQIYILNPKDFSIQEKVRFGKKGDYEAISYIDDDIVVAKNNGTLYRYNFEYNKTTIIKNEFKAENNIEGLCYDAHQNQLLIAAKGQPLGSTQSRKNEKCIYAYDLKERRLITQPFLTIHEDSLVANIKELYANQSKTKLQKAITKAKDFAPSGIAIHPTTGDYYIISARGSSIAIYKNKNLKQLEFFNNKTIPQPEGITFDDEGNLYIATEGKGFSGKIFKFNSK